MWFFNALRKQAEEELEEDFEFYIDDDSWWADFFREPPEATGDEPDDFDFNAPKIYEEVSSFEYLKMRLMGMYFESKASVNVLEDKTLKIETPF